MKTTMNDMTPKGDTGLAGNYSRSGAFGARLGAGTRQGLLMVDFARAYFEPESPLFANVPQVADAASELLEWARGRGLLVCHTRVVYDADGLNGGVFYRKIPALSVFREGDPLGDFVEALRPAAHEPVISKQYASAFFGTSLASLLNAQKIDCVIVAGMSTSGCVRATAVDAIQHGYIPIVASEACGDRHPAPHDASLFDLQAKYADVLSIQEIRHLVESAAGR
ncbi:isochorismatase family protein [Variovorax ginsengisoli]|uniref:Isochorismatase family protein n=1 Tax=Variovorax ginsengisoli TaxID=363844 RepID=A0ABT8SFH3_9BURK|nr:isochorismatase family protein [Variovorax ginsengisoli]MDN8618499.1 isochorismatase family protein [Variovorax ginsengisoli]MDO1537669.1 isochorismatase family protein [Variovorax ginsengisoli]